MPSWFWVPVSRRSGRFARRRFDPGHVELRRSATHGRRARRRADRRTCRPSRRGSRSRTGRRRRARAARSGRHRRRPARRRRAPAVATAATSLIVPSAFDAAPMATSRVRGPIARASAVVVDSPGVDDQRHRPHDHAAIPFERAPGVDVGVMIELGDHHLVARLPAPHRGPGRGETSATSCWRRTRPRSAGTRESRRPCGGRGR